MTAFADVVFARPLIRAFTYAVPSVLAGGLSPGVRVKAPFGRQTIAGFVVRVHDEPPADGVSLKEISAVIDPAPVLPAAVTGFTRRLAEYHVSSWGEMLEAGLPPCPAPPRKRRAPRKAGPGRPAQLTLDFADVPGAAAAAAVRVGGLLEESRSAALYAYGGEPARLAFLAGAARETLARGRNVLVLVPEVSRIAPLKDRLEETVGAVAVLHGQQTPLAQAEEWTKAERGEARVFLGSRAALFKPWPALGLVAVEDESDEAYLQSESPAHDVRRGARFRAEEERAVLVLGSDVPSVEAFARAREEGTLIVLEPGRGRREAIIVVVDDGGGRILAGPVEAGLRDCLSSGEKAIIFLNRRGYASFLFCPGCGFVPRCGRCGASLSYFKREDRLVCRACGTAEARPPACPVCGRGILEPRGVGVEAVEEEVRRIFPGAKAASFDSDRVRSTAARARVLDRFRRGAVDVLVGTQLLARRTDVPPAGFVAVLNPETALAFPALAASQRAFQALQRMLRFAPPSGRPAVVQTSFPDHHAIRMAARDDYEGFFAEEIALRRLLGDPPFGAAAEVVLRGREGRVLGRKARALAGRLRAAFPGVEVLGPSFVSGPGQPGEKRVQLVLRAAGAERITEALNGGLREAGDRWTVARLD